MRNWYIRRRKTRKISEELTERFAGQCVHEDAIITALWDHDDFDENMYLDTYWGDDVDEYGNEGTVIRVEVH
jgi:hypothetical protein